MSVTVRDEDTNSFIALEADNTAENVNEVDDSSAVPDKDVAETSVRQTRQRKAAAMGTPRKVFSLNGQPQGPKSARRGRLSESPPPPVSRKSLRQRAKKTIETKRHSATPRVKLSVPTPVAVSTPQTRTSSGHSPKQSPQHAAVTSVAGVQCCFCYEAVKIGRPSDTSANGAKCSICISVGFHFDCMGIDAAIHKQMMVKPHCPKCQAKLVYVKPERSSRVDSSNNQFDQVKQELTNLSQGLGMQKEQLSSLQRTMQRFSDVPAYTSLVASPIISVGNGVHEEQRRHSASTTSVRSSAGLAKQSFSHSSRDAGNNLGEWFGNNDSSQVNVDESDGNTISGGDDVRPDYEENVEQGETEGTQEPQRDFGSNTSVAPSTMYPFECPLCPGSMFPSIIMYVKHHSLTHHVHPAYCPRCDYSTDNPQELITHYPEAHVPKKRYRCDFCKRSFYKAIELNKHTLVCSAARGKGSAVQNQSVEVDVSGEVESGDTSFTQQDQIMDDVSDDTEETGTFECPQCQKTFITVSRYQRHYQRDHLVKDFRCDRCDKTYLTSRTLAKHIINVHEKSRPKKHVCEYCGKRYEIPMLLDLHVKSVHTGERPFKCTICSNKYAGKAQLRNHMLLHKNPQPWKCRFCGKGFSAGKTRDDHEVVFHTQEYSIFCESCKKGFTDNKLLKRHKCHGPPMTQELDKSAAD